jgi:hypothetical protein
MEYLIGLLVAALGGVFYYKKKAGDASVAAKLAETKGRDAELKQQAKEVKQAIKDIDDSLAKIKAKRTADKKKNDNLSLVELRDKIRKGQK